MEETLGKSGGRLGRALTELDKRLVERTECTVSELAGLIALEEEDIRTLGEWVRSNAETLCGLTHSEYTAGKGR